MAAATLDAAQAPVLLWVAPIAPAVTYAEVRESVLRTWGDNRAAIRVYDDTYAADRPLRLGKSPDALCVLEVRAAELASACSAARRLRERYPLTPLLALVDDTSAAEPPLLVAGVDECLEPRADHEAVARAVHRARARAACAAERARAHGELVAVLAHDLRNPLNVVNLAMSMLDRGLLAADAQKRQFGKVRRALGRVEALIAELVDFAHLEAGPLAITPGEIDVAELLADVEQAMRPMVEEKGLTFTRHDPPQALRAWGERDRLAHVLRSLVGNAARFCPSPGRIDLAAERTPDGQIRFSVTDSGPGVPAEDLPHVFHRSWHSGREARQGAGLSLALAKDIIRAHAGQIGISSPTQRGGGTTGWFTVREPEADDEVLSPTEEQLPPPRTDTA